SLNAELPVLDCQAATTAEALCLAQIHGARRHHVVSSASPRRSRRPAVRLTAPPDRPRRASLQRCPLPPLLAARRRPCAQCPSPPSPRPWRPPPLRRHPPSRPRARGGRRAHGRR